MTPIVNENKMQYIDKLKPEQRARLIKWVEALRSDKYVQTNNQLKNPKTGAMCCLGVACHLINPFLWGSDGEYYYPDRKMGDFECELPPVEVQQLYGMDEELCSVFAGFNDNEGLTFPEIADKIEEFFNLES